MFSTFQGGPFVEVFTPQVRTRADRHSHLPELSNVVEFEKYPGNGGAHVREAGTAVRPGSSTRGPFDCRATRPNDPGTRAVEIHSCVFPPTPHVARPCLDLHRDQHASC